jgi:TRAP-type mannitol/chloroaromatic compound transport system permease small subunit
VDTAPPQLDDESPNRAPSEHHGFLYRIFERFVNVLNSAGSIWIFVLMFLICADVVARSVFNHPIDGVTDISAFSIIGIVFLQIAATVHTNRMTKGDVLLEMVTNRSKRAGAWLESLFLLVGAVMFGLIVRASWPLFTQSINQKQFFGVEGVFTFPTWPIRGIIVLGAAMAALAYLIQIGQALHKAYTSARAQPSMGAAR